MIDSIEKKWIQALLLLTTLSVTLMISPSFSTEPVDLPKMSLLVPFTFFASGFLFNNIKSILVRKYRAILIIVLIFVTQLMVVLCFSGAPFNTQFFGAFGRNTGFLSYISLVIAFVLSMMVSDKKFITRYINTLTVVGLISAFYSLLQLTGNDPIKWNNPYNSIIGFLGNPDFQSSFLGMSSVYLVVNAFFKKDRLPMKFVYIFLLGFVLFVIKKSQAQQGLMVFGMGFAIVTLMYLFKTQKFPKLISYVSSAFFLLTGSIILGGMFKIGPLTGAIYKYSIRQRGFYWHAAIEMMKSHPLFGVGLDSFGNSYFKYRSANAAFHSLPTQSNAAHNVFLDFAANGGLILFSAFIAITLYTLYCAVSIFKNMVGFEASVVALLAVWIGFQAQSIISINQLGLGIWGWILSGLIVGLHLNTKGLDAAPKAEGRKGKRVKSRNVDLLVPSILGVIGIALVAPSMSADHQYRVATANRNATELIKVVLKYPEDYDRTINAAQVLANSKLTAQSLDLAKHVVKHDPKAYNAWSLISAQSAIGTPDHDLAIRHMRELNPHDKSIK